jgi:HTH-type transcriptional regulator, transcriptional repressor of NAD biosynthesis genes
VPERGFETGLVIGKFYPPHRGHNYLIDVACSRARKVTVIVCDHAGHTIPGHLRVAALRESHPDVEVIQIDDIYPPDDSRLWADITVRLLGFAPDAVFTSEDYGDAYAHYMGSAHVQVDHPRVAVPCSGTQVRADPFTWWDLIGPSMHAYYCLRVVVVGAESTGTTTLAEALAAHYNTAWVPEYGRAYSETKLLGANPTLWSSDEFIHIAREQRRQEDAAARHANRILVCDTDAFATTIWHERYLGTADEALEAIARSRQPDLYIVTNVDIPFVQDGTRDGEHIREWMHRRFLQALEGWERPFLVVSGSPHARVTASVEAIAARVELHKTTIAPK